MTKKLFQLLLDNKGVGRAVECKSDGDAEAIYIYDVISADWGVSALSVIRAMSEVKDAPTLHFHINSPGGDVFEGRAIMAAIKAFKGKTVAKIDSLCASAATSIALACDEVHMQDGGFFMIHNASTLVWGDKHAMTETASLLDKVDGAIVSDYIAKTGKEDGDVRALMDAETWYTANEALEAGFIDVVVSGAKPKNMWNLSAYEKPPKIEPEPPIEPATAGFFMSAANTNRLRIAQLV